jgi:hypothetical protein
MPATALRELVSGIAADMRRRRISPALLASWAGVPTADVLAIVSDGDPPSLAIIVKLADALERRGRPGRTTRR